MVYRDSRSLGWVAWVVNGVLLAVILWYWSPVTVVTMWNAAWGADNLYFQNITMFEIPETEIYPSSFQYSISHPWERDFYIELCIVEMVEYIIMMNWNKVRIFPTFGSRPRDSFFIWLLWLMFTLREHIFPFVKEWKEAPAHQIKKMNIVFAIKMRKVGFSLFWVPFFLAV